MRATATFADPCTGARKSTDGSGANSPRGIDHGQSGEAHVPPRWSGHRGRLVAPDESARFWKATPFRAVARVSRYVPLRFTSRDTRRASHDPHEKGTGGGATPGIARLASKVSPCGRRKRPLGSGAGPPQLEVRAETREASMRAAFYSQQGPAREKAQAPRRPSPRRLRASRHWR